MKSLRSTLFALIGILSIILSLVCFSKEVGDTVHRSYYGGDAYTGIQHAAADTGNNVYELTKIVRFGFGSILMVGGLILIASAIPVESKKNEIVETGIVISGKRIVETPSQEIATDKNMTE